MVLACETGGRWHHKALTMVSKLIEAKTQTVAPLLRKAAVLAYHRRWWGILFTALQRTVVPESSAPVGGTRVKTPSGLLGVWMVAETGENHRTCLVCSLHGGGRSSSRSGLIARHQHRGNRSRGLEANRLRRLERAVSRALSAAMPLLSPHCIAMEHLGHSHPISMEQVS